jgi:hypothetical protein
MRPLTPDKFPESSVLDSRSLRLNGRSEFSRPEANPVKTGPLGCGSVRFQRRVSVGQTYVPALRMGKAHRVAPANFGETEPLPPFIFP